jgi:hypothetical protein
MSKTQYVVFKKQDGEVWKMVDIHEAGSADAAERAAAAHEKTGGDGYYVAVAASRWAPQLLAVTTKTVVSKA